MLVLCSGMIRSGSTLQYNLAKAVVEKAGRGRGLGWKEEVQPALTPERIGELCADQQVHVVKAHDLLGLEHLSPTPEGLYVLYSYRDVRDVAGSAKTIWKKEGDALTTAIAEALFVYGAVERMPRRTMQSYELLTERSAEAVAQIASALGIGLGGGEASAIAAEWSKEKVASIKTVTQKRSRTMRDIASRLGLRAVARWVKYRLPKSLRDTIDPLYDKSLYHPQHISENTQKGVASRVALTPGELAAIERLAGDWLTGRGYDGPAR